MQMKQTTVIIFLSVRQEDYNTFSYRTPVTPETPVTASVIREKAALIFLFITSRGFFQIVKIFASTIS